MFKKKKVEIDPNKDILDEYNNKWWKAYDNVCNSVKDVYILSNSVNLFCGKDEKKEEKELQKEKEKLQKYIIEYDIARKNYIDKIDELNFDWVKPSLDGQSLARKELEMLLLKK